MTDAERLVAIREKYRGLQGDMPPFGDVIFLLRLLAEGPDPKPVERHIAIAFRDKFIKEHGLWDEFCRALTEQ